MQSYLRKWHLSNPQEITQTPTSTIYKVIKQDGVTAILKLLSDMGVEDERDGAYLLDYYSGDGAIDIYNHDDGAHLLEYAGDETLSMLVKSGKDKEATQIICDVVRALQQPRKLPYPSALKPLKEQFFELFEAAKKQGADAVIVQAAQVADELFNTTAKEIPLHGDIHHSNIMKSARGWVAIDPKGLIGDPCYDVANIFGNPDSLHDLTLNPQRMRYLADIFSEQLNLSRERILRFAFVHNVLSAVWGGRDSDHRLKIAQMAFNII
ncbi:MAG: 3'-kinase [Micavibrio sp.]|nr:3'-kinase [Micavibrio sp.]